jgi:hypothetical protein
MVTAESIFFTTGAGAGLTLTPEVLFSPGITTAVLEGTVFLPQLIKTPIKKANTNSHFLNIKGNFFPITKNYAAEEMKRFFGKNNNNLFNLLLKIILWKCKSLLFVALLSLIFLKKFMQIIYPTIH